jgi:hypothetical protein
MTAARLDGHSDDDIASVFAVRAARSRTDLRGDVLTRNYRHGSRLRRCQ